jgi:xanthine/uracil/vitamin C permease (AzgA family)
VTEPEKPTADHTPEAPSAAAQLFDLRTIIAVLFGVYGIVLTVQGTAEDEAQLAKAAGIDINLWSGLTMIVVAAVFVVWTWLRPLVPPRRRR